MTVRTSQVRVAVDAMGGDHAPAEIVAGAVRAADDGVDVVLVGRSADIRAQLGDREDGDRITVVDAPDVIGMSEDAAIALRAKPDASIRVAARLVGEGSAQALVSAGSTGATLAAALLTLGRIHGVRRPVVAAVIPIAADREIVLVDAGGSMEVQPDAFGGYARMATAYAQIRGVDDPRVGLLNVGEEPGKGTALAKSAFEALRDVAGFAGNVEPSAVLEGDVDVVVTDGFTGNIFLKTVEATLKHNRSAQTAALLLGVAGEVLVAHGAARAADVTAAVHSAVEVARAGLSGRLEALLQPTGPQEG